jgi:hypothetical protein
MEEKGIVREQLFQLWVTENATGKLVPYPYTPRMRQSVVEEWAVLLKKALDAKVENQFTRGYSEPQVLAHLTLNS